MLRPHKWPFSSRFQVLAYEAAYLAGSYAPPSGRRIELVSPEDLEIESWIEQEGATRLLADPCDREAAKSIWIWKMRATIEASGKTAEPPACIGSANFAEAIDAIRNAKGDNAICEAIAALASLRGFGIRSASAFVFWLHQDCYQIIDKRVTSALDLDFRDEDYNAQNYIMFCDLSRHLAHSNNLTLRQIDRALFAYQKLISGRNPAIIPDKSP